MQNEYIELIPADASLAEQLAEYYRRNREFLEAFEPARSEAFFFCGISKGNLGKGSARLAGKNSVSLLYKAGRGIGKDHRHNWA